MELSQVAQLQPPTDAHLTWYIYQVRCLAQWPISIRIILSLNGVIPVEFAVLLGIYTKQYVDRLAIPMIIFLGK
jgi:hypothetical protein